MKKEEWDRRGVYLLGVALFFRTCRIRRQNIQLYLQVQALGADAQELYQNAEFYANSAYAWFQEGDCLRQKLIGLGVNWREMKGAIKLRAKDFRYRWDILRDDMDLLAYISDDQPEITRDFDTETPIYKREGGDLVKALESVFFGEFSRVTERGEDRCPRVANEEDYWFYLSVWKHCEPELGRGQPRGRRWSDGLHHAVVYADSIE